MNQASEQLGRILVDQSLLTEEELAAHIAAAEAAGRPLAQVLAERLPDGRRTVLRVAAERLGIRFYDPGQDPAPEPEALRVIERGDAEAHLALPVAVNATQVQVAMADPFDQAVLTRLHKVSGYRVVPMLAPREALPEVIAAAYDRLASERAPAAPVSYTHLRAHETT